MKNIIVKISAIIALAIAINLTTATSLTAQCPMCRMSAESNMKEGGTAGKGLNQGILYMLATPYLLVLGGGYFWYRNRRKEDDLVEEVHID